MNWFENKQVVRVGAIIVVLGITTGTFLLREHTIRGQSYRGEIEEVYRTRNWLRLFDDSTTQRYQRYRHYWKVRDDSGRVRDVRVHHLLWNQGEPGTPVRKVAGERSPRIDTPEAERAKELKDQLLHETVDGIRQRFRGTE